MHKKSVSNHKIQYRRTKYNRIVVDHFSIIHKCLSFQIIMASVRIDTFITLGMAQINKERSSRES